MQNVEVRVEGDKLILTVNLKASPTRSASGKSLVIGSTQGNVSAPSPHSEVKIGLNVYRASN